MKKLVCALIALLVMLAAITGCADTNTQKELNTLEDFNDATFGVVTGSIFDGHTREIFPQAEIFYYQAFPDLFQCVSQGKIDGFLVDLPGLNSVKRDKKALTHFDIPGLGVEVGFCFGKNSEGEALKAQMDEFFEKLEADGTTARLIEKWYGEKEPEEGITVPDLSSNTKKLNVAVDTGRKPYAYMKNNTFGGFELEVLYMFCEEYGYNPVISDITFASAIAGLGAKYDVICGGIYITDERKQTINFSEPYLTADVVLVKYDSSADKTDFFTAFKEGFDKTFVREDRWKLIAEGTAVTAFISVLSVVFGSIFGFLLYLGSRSRIKAISVAVKVFTKIHNRIIAGTPVVVILMILYYVVFGSLKDLSGVVIAIFGFTLIFGAFVNEHLSVSVGSVDKGQTEAAYALGYSKNRAFFRIILPQAMGIFMPSYISESVSLVKATAIVGYIAVSDLTKMGDIIRSSTYEAFFPLIATALIYFILTYIVSLILKAAAKKLEPGRRSEKQILRGVK